MDFTTTFTFCFLLYLSLLPLPSLSVFLFTEFIFPNFTASHTQFLDNGGAFLISRNATFRAAIVNLDSTSTSQSTHFYFSVLHAPSNQIIWSANPNSPISNSDKLSLTSNGISLVLENGHHIWSTPPPLISSSVTTAAALQLQESGNLVLLDHLNRSIWQSFDYPTDTIVPGQRFPVGAFLSSAAAQNNASTGNYSFAIVEDDAILQWNGLTYWKLSMDLSAFKDSNSAVSYLMLNATGLYLCGNDDLVVLQLILSISSGFRIAQLDYDGKIYIKTFSGDQWSQDFIGPRDDCRIPNICGAYGLCTQQVTETISSGACSCPSGFHANTQSAGCLPTNSTSLPSTCGGGSDLSSSGMISYEKLDAGIDYFSNDLSAFVTFSVELACADLCTENCSCLGYFYAQSTGSCYLLNNQVGSFVNVVMDTGQSGYIKIMVSLNDSNVVNGEKRRNGRLLALVLIPSSAIFLLLMFLAVALLSWRTSRTGKAHHEVKLGKQSSYNLIDIGGLAIPGLPVNFDYQKLDAATNNFQAKIGSGGFGDVYKGTLPDATIVAVKKMTNSGNQGKKEFLTEIAIIGKVRHVNLVRLRGFCAKREQPLLVYEYMSHGSLDRTLFGTGPVLEWQARFNIALGTARGLAYLHTGCEEKIVHLDIKPENILLDDHFQVKISDFGLSKLLSPEQSRQFTLMRGTRGYLAPEWLANTGISDKADVYSFGMVLLEIVSGRKNLCPTSASPMLRPVYFPLYALEMHEQKKYMELADPKLEGQVIEEEIEKLVRVALCCVHQDPRFRPSMANVVSMLEGEIPLGEPSVEELHFLRYYGYTDQTEAMAPQANADISSTTNGLTRCLSSCISSHQVSGPR